MSPVSVNPSEVRFTSSWSMWCATPSRNSGTDDWAMKKTITFRTAAEFWSLFNSMKTPSELSNSAVEIAIFREGVEPDWATEPCSNGGRWNARMERVASPDSLDQTWLNLVLAVIGNSLVEGDREDGDDSNDDQSPCGVMDHVLGVALSIKGQHNKRMAVWVDTRSKADVLKIGNAIKTNFRTELTDKDIGEMLFHDFESGNKSFCVIANTGKKDRKTAGTNSGLKKNNSNTTDHPVMSVSP